MVIYLKEVGKNGSSIEILRSEMKNYLSELYRYDEPYPLGESVDTNTERFIRDKKTHKYFIYADNEFCGFVIVVPYVPALFERGEDYILIQHLYIKDSFRRKGIGELVFECLKNKYPLPWVLEILKMNKSAYSFWQHCCTKKDLKLEKLDFSFEDLAEDRYYKTWCDIYKIHPNTDI